MLEQLERSTDKTDYVIEIHEGEEGEEGVEIFVDISKIHFLLILSKDPLILIFALIYVLSLMK